jgi:hypothetical protein
MAEKEIKKKASVGNALVKQSSHASEKKVSKSDKAIAMLMKMKPTGKPESNEGSKGERELMKMTPRKFDTKK